jgi:hypothetical protein
MIFGQRATWLMRELCPLDSLVGIHVKWRRRKGRSSHERNSPYAGNGPLHRPYSPCLPPQLGAGQYQRPPARRCRCTGGLCAAPLGLGSSDTLAALPTIAPTRPVSEPGPGQLAGQCADHAPDRRCPYFGPGPGGQVGRVDRAGPTRVGRGGRRAAGPDRRYYYLRLCGCLHPTGRLAVPGAPSARERAVGLTGGAARHYNPPSLGRPHGHLVAAWVELGIWHSRSNAVARLFTPRPILQRDRPLSNAYVSKILIVETLSTHLSHLFQA